MKARAIFSCLFAMNTIFAISPNDEELHVIADETGSPFQHCLALYAKENLKERPVYLRSSAREKQTFFTDITILDLDLSSTTNIDEIMTDIFYSDFDVIHLTNISTEQAMYLLEMLEKNYAHFIHVPTVGKDSLVVSKYSLSQAAITKITRDNDGSLEMLDFFIHGANTHHARIYLGDSLTQIINSNVENDDKAKSCIILADLPCTLTIIHQQYSPLRSLYRAGLLANETFQILPIRNRDGGGKDDDRGGYSAEIEVGGKFGGRDGPSWEAGINFEAYDGHGNYFEADIKQNDKGEGTWNARAGHED
jgi:hypothetical protein